MLLLIISTAFLGAILYGIFGIDRVEKFQRIVKSLLKRDKSFLSSLFLVDEETTRHGGDLVAETLKAHEVQEIFTLIGGYISPILVGAEKVGIRVVDTRHELTAGFAAEAVARLRQHIGVVAVTAGPGLTNTITCAKNAQIAEFPMLVIGGASANLLQGRGGLQDIDQLALFRPVCKFVARVTRVADIVPTIRKAIFVARSDTPGPAFIEFPCDVLLPYKTVVEEISKVHEPKGFQTLFNAYFSFNLSRQFADAHASTDMTPLALKVPLPKPDQVQQLAQLISGAKKPVLLMSNQATLPPVSVNDLRRAVEDIGVPMFINGMARGLVGPNSPLLMRQKRGAALREADLVILAGTVCDYRMDYGQSLPRDAKIVVVNRDYTQLTKNDAVFWHSTLLVQADIGSTLVAVRDRLRAVGWQGAPKSWLETLRQRERTEEAVIERKIGQTMADGRVNPLLALQKLEAVLPADGIIVVDGGDFVGNAGYIVRARGPQTWLDPGAFGSLGMGAGYALAAKLVHPEQPVVIIFGDGGAAYSIMEFDTFVRHNTPVVALIGNDACWSEIVRKQVQRFNSTVACTLAFNDFELIGRAVGANGVRVEKKNEADMAALIDNAIQESLHNGKSTVINVVMGKPCEKLG